LVCCLAVSTCNAFHGSASVRGSSFSTSPLHATRTRPAPTKSKSDYLMTEALQHDLLTREEEKELGLKIQRAAKLKKVVAKFVEEKQLLLEELNLEEDPYIKEFFPDMLVNKHANLGVDQEDIEGLAVFGIDSNRLEQMDGRRFSSMGEEFEDWHLERLRETNYHIVDTEQSSSFKPNTGPLSIDEILTDEDIMADLGIPGGRDELAHIVVNGALAKEKLMSRNVRLVLSIAKTWCQRTSAFSGASQYTGSWDRPSLDEAVQEGILGLSIAADRFEPERNLKFGTYATWWVTNSVRTCFNKAKEVGLRVPIYFHTYRQKYQAFVKQQYELTGGAVTLEEAAKELDLKPKRLAFILRSTTAPISIDAPPNQFQKMTMAGKAGSDDSNDMLGTLSSILKSPEASLEDQIEVTLLRQCLENAMATELSPHERDVLRLRHGLDDGVTRTAREVAEICGGSVSQSDVRTVEMRACRKLRSPYSVHTARLHDFLDFVGANMATVSRKR